MSSLLWAARHDDVRDLAEASTVTYRHDYIIRLIERFGAVLRSLRDKILRREREDLSARAEIAEIARHAGLDLGVARTLPPDLLMMWLAPTGEADPAKLWLMAELLYLEALDCRTTGGQEGARTSNARGPCWSGWSRDGAPATVSPALRTG